MSNPILNDISAALQSGKAKNVKELVQKAIDGGVSANDVLQSGLMAGMDVVAVKFKNNEVYVPEVLMAARAMNAGTETLKPHLAGGAAAKLGKAVIGTVKGDLHDIGKNLVKMMFEGKGIEVFDLGADVAPEAFVAACKEHNPQIVAMSALLTTTMDEMRNTVEALKAAGIRSGKTIMVGGAPLTDEYCKSIGADIYCADAASAAEAAKAAIK